MTRPALAHSNLEPIQAVLPPFVVQCRASAVGSPAQMLVYIVAATYCDQHREKGDGERRRKAGLRDGEMACWPSLDTIRANCGGMGRTTFMGHWRALRSAGFVGTRYGSNAKVVRTLAGAMRARADGIVDRTRAAPVDRPVVVTGNDIKGAGRSKGAPRPTPLKVHRVQHLTDHPTADPPRRGDPPSTATARPSQTPGGSRAADEHDATGHQERPMLCRGCNRTRPARDVSRQHCDKCEHSTDDERRAVRAEIRAAIENARREAGYGA